MSDRESLYDRVGLRKPVPYDVDWRDLADYGVRRYGMVDRARGVGITYDHGAPLTDWYLNMLRIWGWRG